MKGCSLAWPHAIQAGTPLFSPQSYNFLSRDETRARLNKKGCGFLGVGGRTRVVLPSVFLASVP